MNTVISTTIRDLQRYDKLFILRFHIFLKAPKQLLNKHSCVYNFFQIYTFSD
nr:MAG TPA: hypothetical protein [Caudoviricetes sp.]